VIRVRDEPATIAAAHDDVPDPLLARRLAAAGLRVQCSRGRDTCKLTILGVTGGKSCLAVRASGDAHWYYEPAAGSSASPATLTAIIAYLPGRTPRHHPPGGLSRFPPQRTGRAVPAGSGLTVTLHVSEDLESFEATTEIESPAPPTPGWAPFAWPMTRAWTGTATGTLPSATAQAHWPMSSHPSCAPAMRNAHRRKDARRGRNARRRYDDRDPAVAVVTARETWSRVAIFGTSATGSCYFSFAQLFLENRQTTHQS
jgi:hypothetical protein